MIVVAQAPAVEVLEVGVVLAIRSGEHDRPCADATEYDLGERVESFGVEVLDDLGGRGHIEASQPGVGVGQRALQQLDPLPASLRHRVELETLLGSLQSPYRDVDTHYAGHCGLSDQPFQQASFAASEVDDPSRSDVPHRLEHRVEALLAQAGRQFGRSLRCVAFRVEEVGVLAGVGQTRQGLPGELAEAQVPVGDQLGLGMSPEPVAAPPQQLVHLVGTDPVVLGVIEHREQHVEMLQRGTHGVPAGQSSRCATTVAPSRELGIERYGSALHVVAQRIE